MTTNTMTEVMMRTESLTDTNEIYQSKFRSVCEICKFILNLMIGYHLVGFAFALVSGGLYTAFLFLVLLCITLYIKNSYVLSSYHISVSWFHINILFISVFYTYTFGWESGFWLFLVSLVFLNYFCGFSNRLINYFLAIFEIAFILILYVLFADTPYKIDIWIAKGIYVCCFILNYFVFFRLCLFSNILTSSGYIDLKEQQQQLEQISNYDHLTGLLNRRSMESIIKLKSKALRSDESEVNKVVMLGDIDDFKKINDTFGHSYGDLVLKDISNTLKNSFRKDDYVCRWGGEEFLIILPNTNIDFVYHLSERLLKNISKTKLPNSNPVTMTFGMVICIGDTDLDTKSIIEKADQLLYKGKKAGKDRIEMEILK